MFIEHDRRHRKLVICCLRLPDFELKVVHRVEISYQTVNMIYRLSAIGIDKYPLEDDVLVLRITRTQAEGKPTKTKTRIWRSVLSNDGMDTIKTGLLDVLQVSAGTVNAKWQSTRNLMLTRRMTHTVGKFSLLWASWDPSIRWPRGSSYQPIKSTWLRTEGRTGITTWLSIVHVALPVMGTPAGDRRRYDTLWGKFHHAHMANDAYTTRADCLLCAVQGMKSRHQKE